MQPIHGNQSRHRRKHFCLPRRRMAHVTADCWVSDWSRESKYFFFYFCLSVRVNDYKTWVIPNWMMDSKTSFAFNIKTKVICSRRRDGRRSKGFKKLIKTLFGHGNHQNWYTIDERQHRVLPGQFSIWLIRVKMRRRNETARRIMSFGSIQFYITRESIVAMEIKFFSRPITAIVCARAMAMVENCKRPATIIDRQTRPNMLLTME